MKGLVCNSCGSNDLYEENGYRICRYCGTKHIITADDKPQKESIIDLQGDIDRLLRRAKEEPTRARQCAQRILELDSSNQEAKRILASTNANYSSNSGGCYIATSVYGSYDCSQVWTLRRYRDFTLAKTWYGRAFIRIYYLVSPSLVNLFGQKTWFNSIWKPLLDSMVSRLNEKGFNDTPYHDR